MYPAQPELSPEEEFFQFIERFPSIASQFRQAKAVRDWTRTGRIQYGAKQVVGDRFCLLGQAAGFVDPLFSKGLYTALTCTSVLAERLLAAKTVEDYSAVHFQPVEALTLAYLQANDQLVANAYKSFSDYRLWSPFSVLWLVGAYLELLKLTSSRALAVDRPDYYQQLQGLRLVGGGFPDFEQLAQRVYALLEEEAAHSPADIPQLVQQMTQQLEQISWMPYVFKAVLHGKNHLPNNKLHPRLFRPKQGFLGTGMYRSHFFANRSLPFFLDFYVRERVKYSHQLLQLKRGLRLRKRGLVRPMGWGRLAAIATLLGTGLFMGHSRQLSGFVVDNLEKRAPSVVGRVLDNPTVKGEYDGTDLCNNGLYLLKQVYGEIFER